jgi:hypothetical protein
MINHEKIVPVTLLLTEQEVNDLLKITRDKCKMKNKSINNYCEQVKCFSEHNKIENSMLRPKNHFTHNCFKLIEAKDHLNEEIESSPE